MAVGRDAATAMLSHRDLASGRDGGPVHDEPEITVVVASPMLTG